MSFIPKIVTESAKELVVKAQSAVNQKSHENFDTEPPSGIGAETVLSIFASLILLFIATWIVAVVLLVTRFSIMPTWAVVLAIIALLPLPVIPPGTSLIAIGIILGTTKGMVVPKSAFF